jgi:hypothetical protein
MTLLPIWQSNLQLKFSEMQPIMQCSRAENVGPGARLDLGSRQTRSGPSSVRVCGLQQIPAVIAGRVLDRAFSISPTGAMRDRAYSRIRQSKAGRSWRDFSGKI